MPDYNYKFDCHLDCLVSDYCLEDGCEYYSDCITCHWFGECPNVVCDANDVVFDDNEKQQGS